MLLHFIYIKHIRLQDLEYLMQVDFAPCNTPTLLDLLSSILDQVSKGLKGILPKCSPPYQSLSHLMATYKQHKDKYRWLTDAFYTVFSNIALLLTITSKKILESFKEWACFIITTYKTFLKVDISVFLIMDSIIDTTLNLPDSMTNFFVADISRCYEMIPLQGPDKFVATIAFK